MTTPRHRLAVLASTLLLGIAVPAAPALAHPAAHKSTAATTKAAAAKAAAAKAAAAKAAAAKAKANAAKGPVTPTVTAMDTVPTLASRLALVKVAKTLNYYPTTAGWSAMWTNWNATKVDADLAKAATLGANNLRVILFPSTMGYPTPSATYLSRLSSFVTMAANHGMTVKFTLFDWWDGYSDVAGSTAWAKAVLTPYVSDKRLISVEVKNEFDPTDASAVTWAKKIVPAIRTAFPTLPLSFSVDGTQGATGLAKIKAAMTASPMDFYDFHFYGNSERALANIQTAQAAVSPTPLVIGEVGLNTLQNSEGEQAAFLARVFEAAKVAGVGSVAPWTLYDFNQGAIPSSAVSALPAQYAYGLYHTDGSAKPAAAVVQAEWKGTALPSTVMDLGFENPAGDTPWSAYLPEQGMAVKTSTVAHSGKYSVQLTDTVKSAAGSPSFRVAPITPVKAGQKWHGEVWAKGLNTTGTTEIALSWFDKNDKWLGSADSTWLPNGTVNWTKLSVDGFAPAGAASMQVHLRSGDNKGTVWFDDVALTSS